MTATRKHGKVKTKTKATPITTDRFEIPLKEIPRGISYQWVRHELYGDDKWSEVQPYLKSGWKKVPYSRHKILFEKKLSKDGGIQFQGLALLELSTKKLDEIRKRDYDKAVRVLADSKDGCGSGTIGILKIVYPGLEYVKGYKRWKRDVSWKVLGILFGLTEGQLIAANDGTLPWNNGPNAGRPIGTRELIRRVALMRKSHEIPSRNLCLEFLSFFKRRK